MFKFFKDSLKEFDHVQWPTPTETKTYFKIVTLFITVFAVVLYVTGSLLSSGLFFARETLNIKQPAAITASGATPDINVKDINLQTGAINTIKADSGATATGATTGTGN